MKKDNDKIKNEEVKEEDLSKTTGGVVLPYGRQRRYDKESWGALHGYGKEDKKNDDN